MNKKGDVWEGMPECFHCGTLMSKRTIVEIGGQKCRAWQCPKDGEEIVHPGDAQDALAANKLKHGVKLKVGELNKAPYVRFTKEFSKLLHKGGEVIATMVSPNEFKLKIVH